VKSIHNTILEFKAIVAVQQDRSLSSINLKRFKLTLYREYEGSGGSLLLRPWPALSAKDQFVCEEKSRRRRKNSLANRSLYSIALEMETISTQNQSHMLSPANANPLGILNA
jgi:hypothetical protein